MESKSHSFVVTVWPEKDSGSTHHELRGHVTHAYTKERGSVKELVDILAFMKPYVAKMGVKLDTRSRLALMMGALGLRKQKRRKR